MRCLVFASRVGVRFCILGGEEDYCSATVDDYFCIAAPHVVVGICVHNGWQSWL